VKFKERVTKRQRNDPASLAGGKFKDKNEDGIKEVLSRAGRGILGAQTALQDNLGQFVLFST
jgi:hypothetical protein